VKPQRLAISEKNYEYVSNGPRASGTIGPFIFKNEPYPAIRQMLIVGAWFNSYEIAFLNQGAFHFSPRMVRQM